MRLRNDLGGYWCGLAACALTAALVIMPASGALAASAGHAPWRLDTTPNATAPSGQLESVSCSAANACTAVGSAIAANGLTVTLAERWNGTSWQSQQTPNPAADTEPVTSPTMLGVSCPDKDSCEAVGAYTVGVVGVSLAEGWNGQAWTLQAVPVPRGSASAGLNQVSCPTAQFCEAIGSYRNGIGNNLAFAATWNGSSWHLQRVPNPPAASDVFVTALSCVSATFCEAGGNSLGAGAFAERWDGTKWHLQALPGTSGTGSMSCVSASFCESVGFGGADKWDGMSWTAQTIPASPGGGTAQFSGVSCATAGSCQAVGKVNGGSGGELSAAASWDGTAWASQAAPSPAGAQFAALTSVSCVAAATCEAAGTFQISQSQSMTLAESWDGSGWQIQHADAPPGATSNDLSAVSCASRTFCEAVGSHQDRSGLATVALAEEWTGTAWKIQRAASPVQAANGLRMRLTGVSCISARFCEAVGASSSQSGGGAEMWNGTKWTLQTVPSDELTAVSCTSATFCLATTFDGHVDRWNGTAWSQHLTAPGFEFLHAVSCAAPRSCEVLGSGPSGDQAERWNGSTWSAQTTPVPVNGSSPGLSAVSCSAANSCEAAGSYLSSTFQTLSLAEKWNGTSWKVQPTPNPAAALADFGTTSFSGIWCTSSAFCAAVGQYTAGVPTLTLAEVWNGKVWALRSTPNRPSAGQNGLNSVSCAGAVCTAVGVTADLGQTQATLAESGN